MGYYCREVPLLCISTSARNLHWPIIFGDAGPKYPYHDDRQESEKGFEKGAIDFTIRRFTQMNTDDVLENLPQGEE